MKLWPPSIKAFGNQRWLYHCFYWSNRHVPGRWVEHLPFLLTTHETAPMLFIYPMVRYYQSTISNQEKIGGLLEEKKGFEEKPPLPSMHLPFDIPPVWRFRRCCHTHCRTKNWRSNLKISEPICKIFDCFSSLERFIFFFAGIVAISYINISSRWEEDIISKSKRSLGGIRASEK